MESVSERIRRRDGRARAGWSCVPTGRCLRGTDHRHARRRLAPGPVQQMTPPRFGKPTPLAGRGAEGARLDRLLADARARQSAVLVLRGEPGIGKTALLGYAAKRAAGFQVVRAAGVESEMELPFASLHQLCGPMLG